MQRRINSLMRQMMEPMAAVQPFEGSAADGSVSPHRRAFWPSCDVKETKDGLTVNAELPGMKKEDINVTVQGGLLSIKGERKFEKTDDQDGMHHVERSYGSFIRRFQLPPGAEEDKIAASYKDGILKVEIPKKPDAIPAEKKIELHD